MGSESGTSYKENISQFLILVKVVTLLLLIIAELKVKYKKILGKITTLKDCGDRYVVFNI